MILPRREFLRLLGITTGAAGIGGCGSLWSVPDEMVERALRGPGLESEVQTVCGLCPSGCGVTVRLVDNMPVGLKGNPHHPLNRGGLCPVGLAGLELLYGPDRLRVPLRRQAGGLENSTWEEALGDIAARLAELRRAGEGSRIAVLHDEPGFLFDDLAQRFGRSLGSPNVARPVDPESLAYKLTQGIDAPPAFDLAETDLVLTFGLDLYEEGPAPLHAISSMIGARSTEERARTIHVGTRLSPSASKAEEWVAVQPGTHAAFALGVAHVLVREQRYDADFVAGHTFGFDDWTDDGGRRRMGFRRLLMERYYPDRAAQFCGVEPAAIVRVARRLAGSSAGVAVAGGEVMHGTNATFTVMAVHALNALMGAFDRPGGVTLAPPIPVAPMPAAELPSVQPDSTVFARLAAQAFAGGDPIEALAGGVLDGSAPLEVLLVVSCDPVHESPAGGRLRQAMERIPMVVTFTPFLDRTSEGAHYVLPTPLYLERWQGTTTPSTVPFSSVGVARPVVEPLYDTRHPGDLLIELHRLAEGDGASMPWDDYATYLEQRLQGLALSRQGSIVTGSFEESWVHFLEERGWRFPESRRPDDYWDELLRRAAWWNPVRPREDWEGLFATDSGRYEFWSRGLQRRLAELGAAGGDLGADQDPLALAIDVLGLDGDAESVCLPHFEPPRLAGEGELTLHPFRPLTARGNLGRYSPMVLEMFGHSVMTGWRTWAEISPETAAELDIGDGDLVELESDQGVIEAVIHTYPSSLPGVVHVSVGLGHTLRDHGVIGSNPMTALLAVRDPVSGSLSESSTRVRARLIERRSHGMPSPAHRKGTP
jgi:anaerobic selenocysteine-containing dehydrogenase